LGEKQKQSACLPGFECIGGKDVGQKLHKQHIGQKPKRKIDFSENRERFAKVRRRKHEN
jgi:hypothetical protein